VLRPGIFPFVIESPGPNVLIRLDARLIATGEDVWEGCPPMFGWL